MNLMINLIKTKNSINRINNYKKINKIYFWIIDLLLKNKLNINKIINFKFKKKKHSKKIIFFLKNLSNLKLRFNLNKMLIIAKLVNN